MYCAQAVWSDCQGVKTAEEKACFAGGSMFLMTEGAYPLFWKVVAS